MKRALRLQGCYYLLGGLWPLVGYRSFERLTGPKPDRFVTEVASALYAVIGAAILTGSRAEDPVTARRLAILTAMVTAAMDVRHRPDIRVVYAGEAAVELMLTAATVVEGRTAVV